MRHTIFLVDRLAAIAPVVHQARLLMHSLMQGSAQRDIDFLKAPADPQNRHATLQGQADHGQGPGIALRVQRQRLVQHVFTEVAGMHIGGGAGQQQAISQIQQGRQLIRLGCGNHKRHPTSHAHRIDVFLACHMKRMTPQHALACGHQHDGRMNQVRTHDATRCKQCAKAVTTVNRGPTEGVVKAVKSDRPR